MQDLKVLKSVRYVIDEDGRKAAVQVSIEDWGALLSYLEDLEDRALVRDMLVRLRKGPEEAYALPWQEARKDW